MQHKQKPNSKTKTLTIIVAFIVALLAVGGYLVYYFFACHLTIHYLDIYAHQYDIKVYQNYIVVKEFEDVQCAAPNCTAPVRKEFRIDNTDEYRRYFSYVKEGSQNGEITIIAATNGEYTTGYNIEMLNSIVGNHYGEEKTGNQT